MSPTPDYTPQPLVKLRHPEWSKDAALYQINTRQFTPEGTLAAAAEHLPRLKDLGAHILWLMPVQEIGVINRKGTLGSPYAVRDYFSVNTEFGTIDDLRDFVRRAHALGMHVILDWVANHTAWDNPLVDEHPGWYLRDWKGDFRPTSWWDWADIIELDYSQPGVRRYMTEAMAWWVRETDIDGFRCDTAGFVPTDFWDTVRVELDKIKPVFMLAEWEARDLHAKAFDATYAWTWFNALHAVASGRTNLDPLYVYYSWHEKSFSPDCMRMHFVTNHDKNSWDGTEFEHFGDGVQAAIALSVLSVGIPMIYNGQEAGNERRLEFFERDPISWREHPHGELYRKLFALKKSQSALWNGAWGAPMIHVPNTENSRVLSFSRRNSEGAVLAAFNFHSAPASVRFTGGPFEGNYTEFVSGGRVALDSSTVIPLEGWGYRIWVHAA